MSLLDQLERALGIEESYFRAQLLREDVARLKKLRELASAAATEEQFLRDGLYLDWTPSGLRNADLKATLEPLLRAVFAAEKTPGEPDSDTRLLQTWRAFDQQRIDLLVGCLARVPKPDLD